jgi:hypothetical protein
MTLAPGALVAVEIAELLPESLPVDEARACRRWRVDGCLGLTLMEACRRQRRSAELGARAGRRGDIQADGTARSRWNGYAHLPDGPASCPIQLEAVLGDGDASVRLCLNADELADSMGELPVPRLLIEVEFAALGLVRLELKAPSGYLQLVVRSRLILPPAARSRLADLFGTACQLTGRRGAIHFHSTLPQMTAGRQGPPAAGLPALGRGALPLDPEPAAG